MNHDPNRRVLVQTLLTLPALALIGCEEAASSTTDTTFSPSSLSLTPACDDDDGPTEAQTEGPYFKPSSPGRSSLLESGLAGTRLVLTGRVLSVGCKPIARALLDFWQADNGGAYDLSGFRLRGHQFTDADGRFSLETIVPGLYPGRTRHIHVKVQAANGPILTTQLYFPDEARNASDGIYSPSLVMGMSGSGSSREGMFDFVLK